jgi:hypothetical protein
MPWFEFESGTFPWFYPTTFVSCGESHFLVLWCTGDRCDMSGAMRIVEGVEDLVQRN